MPEELKQFCKVASASSGLFVGLRFNQGSPEVVFPRGYSLATDDCACRKDIISLITVLRRFSQRDDGASLSVGCKSPASFPFYSYLYILKDYLNNGYYVEREHLYKTSPSGKISWRRTIQKENPVLDGNNIVYLHFQVKSTHYNEDNILNEVHRYCVFVSFHFIGWLFFPRQPLPQRPVKPFRKGYYISVLRDAISNTNNDDKHKLLTCMLSVIQECDSQADINNVSIGVDHFEYIWQGLVDYFYGCNEISSDLFYPFATWHSLTESDSLDMPPLRPDTIMLANGSVYVLDSKYYNYVSSNNLHSLPGTADVQKQITYGKYVNKILVQGNAKYQLSNVYNAFLLPYDLSGTDCHVCPFAIATADWEYYGIECESFLFTVGVLVDTKWLMSVYSQHDESSINILATQISSAALKYRASLLHP